jgi:hypothetical protein
MAISFKQECFLFNLKRGFSDEKNLRVLDIKKSTFNHWKRQKDFMFEYDQILAKRSREAWERRTGMK